MKFMRTQIFKTILILCVLLKSVVGFLHFDYTNGDKIDYRSISFKKDFSLQCTDEPEFITSAIYFTQSGKIMTDRFLYLSNIPKQPPVYLSAIRPKAYIYLHYWGLKIYAKQKGIYEINKKTINIYDYLHYYHLMMCILKTLLFPISLIAFFKSIKILGFNHDFQYVAAILYTLIPSVFIFIGYLDMWENIALYSLLIVYYTLLKNIVGDPISRFHYIVFFLLLGISVLFRPHLLLIYMSMLGFTFFLNVRKFVTRKVAKFNFLPLMGLVFIVLIHIPILVQNHQYFGKYFLSTQSNFEFYQGHNEFARGSWNMNLVNQHPAYFDSLIKSNNLVTADELSESLVYKKIANDWIVKHPLQEIVLSLRKIAGYFLPFNFMNHRVNLYTLVLFISFFAACFRIMMLVIKRHKFQNAEILVLTFIPCLVSIGLTLLFFVGERWRFYAEPFFLIFFLSFLNKFYFKNNPVLA